MQKKALLLSAYDAESHRHWHQMLANGLPAITWTVITLPAHHFFWRARSNGLSFALNHGEILSAGYDVLVATSMLDLATLRGLVPELASIPALIYFHENQFVYPLRNSADENRILNAQLSSVVTAWSADRILFNSTFNRSSFLAGTQSFIKRMPDGLLPTIAHDIEQKSTVLPVPIAAEAGSEHNNTRSDNDEDTKFVDMVWAHRWEFDKQPDVFFNALEKLYRMPEFIASGLIVRLHVMGQAFRDVPECFQRALDSGIHNVKTWGYQNRADYIRILASSNYVISTALHDFQGLSMIEAIHHGCIPVAPNRVAYPEYIPKELLYEETQPEQESDALAAKLCLLLCSDASKETGRIRDKLDMSLFLEEQLINRYGAELNSLLYG